MQRWPWMHLVCVCVCVFFRLYCKGRFCWSGVLLCIKGFGQDVGNLSFTSWLFDASFFEGYLLVHTTCLHRLSTCWSIIFSARGPRIGQEWLEIDEMFVMVFSESLITYWADFLKAMGKTMFFSPWNGNPPRLPGPHHPKHTSQASCPREKKERVNFLMPEFWKNRTMTLRQGSERTSTWYPPRRCRICQMKYF